MKPRRVPVLSLDRAIAICDAISDRVFFPMGLVATARPLEGVSLDEMLRAAALVRQANRDAKAVNGTTAYHVVPDDRLIAAAYVLQHYDAGDDQVAVPGAEEGTVKVLGIAVLPLNQEDDVHGKQETA